MLAAAVLIPTTMARQEVEDAKVLRTAGRLLTTSPREVARANSARLQAPHTETSVETSVNMASSGNVTPDAAVLLIPTVMIVVAAALLAPTIKKLVAKRTSSVQLLYFDLPGLGEPIRFLLAHLGVPFEVRRFKAREEFIALKPTLKFGQVPCLKLDGEELFQSSAILRALAQKFDVSGTLYPADACLASQVDGLIAQVSDMTQGWGPLRYRERFGFPADLFTDAAQAT